jgi:hypothetical protein
MTVIKLLGSTRACIPKKVIMLNGLNGRAPASFLPPQHLNIARLEGMPRE